MNTDNSHNTPMSSDDNLPGVVSAAWLKQQFAAINTDLQSGGALTNDDAHQQVHNGGFVLFDATYHLTDKSRDPLQEWQDEHIAGSRFFDVVTIADVDSDWPNTVPSKQQFETTMQELGVSNEHTIIAYDRLGLFSAARVWWMFRYFGHSRVAVLDGGLPAWLNSGGDVYSGDAESVSGSFTAQSERSELLVSAEEVARASASATDSASTSASSKGPSILDARGAGRFKGESPEPRAGLRAGHIPGSYSLPFTSLLNDDATYKSPDEIRQILLKQGVTEDSSVITSCGSGITACVLSLGMSLAGFPDAALFDGSWTEWGSREEFPVATGA